MLLHVAGCSLKQGGKLLMLQRSSQKSQGGLWGFPAGKIESNETPLQGAVREVREETGIVINSDNLVPVKVIHYDFGDTKVDFHLFTYHVGESLKVTINPVEHQAFGWFTPDEARNHEQLMQGVVEILDALKA